MAESMFNNFKRVLLIACHADLRPTLKMVLKDIGIAELVVAGSAEEGWGILETSDRPFDWVIITKLEAVTRINAFAFLTLFIDEPRFAKTRVSFLLEEQEQYALPFAFELGLFSWHAIPFSKVSIQDSFLNLAERWKNCLGNDVLVAASYLREYFKGKENYHDLIELEKILVSKFPRHSELLLKLAEAQYLGGKFEDAKKTILQAKYLGSSMEKAATQLKNIIDRESGGEANNDKKSFAEAFGINSCLIIDSDNSSCLIIKEALEQINVPNIHIFTDGESAWTWIKSNPEPAAIIQEWRIPKLSGVALVQRIRQTYKTYVPIFIVSSLVKEDDLPLLREIGVSAVIEKPPSKEYFLSNLMNVLQQERFPTDYKVIERMARQAISKVNLEAATELVEKYEASEAPLAGKKALAAEMALAKKDFPKVKELAMEAFHLKGDAVFILNTLGKVMLKIGDSEGAIKCFARSQEMSPKNLERLCLLSEAYSDVGEVEFAKKTVEEAKIIDTKNPLVVETEAKVAISSGDLSTAREAMSNMESFTNLVAYMNNKAVVSVRQGQPQEGIELYKKALETLPGNKNAERLVLLYNLGLAYVRIDDIKLAIEALAQVTGNDKSENDLISKAGSLKSRLESASVAGKKVVLNTNEDAFKETSMKSNENAVPTQIVCRPLALHIKPGEMRLHQIYRYKDENNKYVSQFLSNRPKFASRLVKC